MGSSALHQQNASTGEYLGGLPGGRCRGLIR
jgi:hypothetical protein